LYPPAFPHPSSSVSAVDEFMKREQEKQFENLKNHSHLLTVLTENLQYAIMNSDRAATPEKFAQVRF